MLIVGDKFNDHEVGHLITYFKTDFGGGQASVLFRLWKEYFATLAISTTGWINEELDHLSRRSEMLTLQHAQAIDPYVSDFLKD